MRTVTQYVQEAWRAWRDYPQRNGTVIAGRYIIRRCLGTGSYGLSYLCHDRHKGLEVVLKQPKPSKGSRGRALLEREIQILERLNHPQIPRCLDHFESGKRLWMVVEYIEGKTVEELIFEQGRDWSERDCLEMTARLTNIVRYVHQEGWVHLDIRIPNVILDGHRMTLIDFGLARAIGDDPKELAEGGPGRHHTGVPGYRWKEASVAADLFDIGHFLLFMLYSGYVPDRQTSDESWEEELTLSAGTRVLLRRLFQLERPYEDAEQFAQELEAVLATPDPSGKPPTIRS